MQKQKKTNKGVVFFGITTPLILLSVTFVSGGFSDVLEEARSAFFGGKNKITGMDTSRLINVSFTVAGSAPIVEAIYGNIGPTLPSQSVTENSITEVLFSFTVTDVDGTAGINDATANITLIDALTGIIGEANNLSSNTSCFAEADIDADTANFTCIVHVNYWFNPGEWNITAGIEDSDGTPSHNTSNFTVASTTAVVISPLSFSFGSLTIGAANTTADNPVVVNNTANAGVTAVNVNAIDLIGEETVTETIDAPNFSVDVDTGGTPPAECRPDLGSTQLVNATATAIAGATLAAGNRSFGEGNETLYPCFRFVPSGLSAQSYSTLNGTAWTVSV